MLPPSFSSMGEATVGQVKSFSGMARTEPLLGGRWAPIDKQEEASLERLMADLARRHA
jgi:hypothetical protein